VTYSIVARDPESGDLGVAVQSHYLSVGSVVPWLESGVGAVATQSFVQPSYGPLGLALLRAGVAPADALRALTTADADAARRQVAFLHADGRVAAHTGDGCIPAASDLQGDGFSVQANMMRDEGVPEAMTAVFTAATGPLPMRLLAALDAAEAAGGDIRGRQSAALVVVRGTPTGRRWDDVLLDIRVEDHRDPLVELRRIVTLKLAYQRADAAGALLVSGDVDGAFTEFAAARSDAPDDCNLTFAGVLMAAGAGRIDDAVALAAELASVHDGWTELLRRLPAMGLLPDNPDALERLGVR